MNIQFSSLSSPSLPPLTSSNNDFPSTSLALQRNRYILNVRDSTCNNFMRIRPSKVRVKVLTEVTAATAPTDLAEAQVSWQIVVGAIAGVTPFIVAGIEFSKRIIAQRKCEVCGGSGLVLRNKEYYSKCPGCGGFLPWQSWKRFFSG